MKSYLIDKNSDNLIIFFTGWGCDEHEFKHLTSCCDVLLLYDYSDFNFNFDFSKYKEINLIAYSAGVFVASVFDFDCKINKKIAISGNPYLFDEYYGLSQNIQNILCNITIENADDFAKNYLVKTDDEYNIFKPSKRTFESCNHEFECLKSLYETNKDKIKNIYDLLIIGADDTIFNLCAQKEYYKNKVKIIKNARHNMFFKIKSYDEIFQYLI